MGRPSAPLPTAAETERERISEALLDDARRQFFGNFHQSTPVDYSRDLAVLQRQVTNYLKQDQNAHFDRAIVMDPNKLDIGMALGGPVHLMVGGILHDYGMSPEAINDLARPVAERLLQPHVSKFSGITSYTTAPTTHNVMKPEGSDKVCVVVPASDHNFPFEIPGLSAAERRTFANTHEAWHCRDSRNALTVLDERKIGDIDKTDKNALLRNREALRYMSLSFQKEAFADTAALGEMIRSGSSPGIIDAVSRWRKQPPYDLIHTTFPVLDNLKGEIDRMGLERFRSLNERQARDFYYSVTERHGLNQDRLKTMLAYGNATPVQRIGYHIEAEHNPETKKALDFIHKIAQGSTTRPASTAPLSRADRQKLAAWNPMETLERDALAASGKITPTTLIGAYGRIHDRLVQEAGGPPAAPLASEKAVKLRAVFMTQLRAIDYVAVNEKYGVSIRQDAAVVSGLSAPPAAAESGRAASAQRQGAAPKP